MTKEEFKEKEKQIEKLCKEFIIEMDYAQRKLAESHGEKYLECGISDIKANMNGMLSWMSSLIDDLEES